MATDSASDSDEGFMLPEALLALVILTIVSLSLINLSDSVEKGSIHIRKSICAQWVITNQIALINITNQSNKNVVKEGISTMCNTRYYWKFAMLDNSDPRLRIYDIQVYERQQQVAHQNVLLAR